MDLTYLRPPEEGDTTVIALVSGVASTAQDLFGSNGKSGMVTFWADEKAFITFSKSVEDTITDPLPTSVSGNGQCWPIAKDTPTSFFVGKRNRYFKAISLDSTYLRWRFED